MSRRRDTSPDYTRQLAAIQLLEKLAAALQTMSPRERDVITLLYGLHDGIPRDVTEIAQLYGTTVASVRLMVTKTTSKLRHPSRGMPLHEYLDSDGGVLIPDHIRAAILGGTPTYLSRIERFRCDLHGWQLPTTPPGQRCAHCPCEVPASSGGRPRRYCSSACRQAAYRRRPASTPTA